MDEATYLDLYTLWYSSETDEILVESRCCHASWRDDKGYYIVTYRDGVSCRFYYVGDL